MTFEQHIEDVEKELQRDMTDFERTMCQAFYDAGYRRGYNNGYLDRTDKDYEC